MSSKEAFEALLSRSEYPTMPERIGASVWSECFLNAPQLSRALLRLIVDFVNNSHHGTRNAF